jgi:hypothetical protein
MEMVNSGACAIPWVTRLCSPWNAGRHGGGLSGLGFFHAPRAGACLGPIWSPGVQERTHEHLRALVSHFGEPNGESFL